MARFVPARHIDGASPIGNTYLASFASCPYEWFTSYYRPGEPGTVGLTPKWSKPSLNFGQLFHLGLAQWYISGVVDGEDTGARNVDQAIAEVERHWKLVEGRYESNERAHEDYQEVLSILRAYHDRFGPRSPYPEYPTEFTVACNGNGEPLIEKEFQIDLGYGGYVFTSRPDAIGYKRGYLITRDHKTSISRFVGERKATIHWDPQFTGHYLVMNDLFPDEHLNGAEVNVVIKYRAAKSKFDIAERDTTSRTPEDLRSYKLECIDLLKRIDEATTSYDLAVSEGMDIELAAEKFFPRHGSRTGRCGAYGGCQFLPLCSAKGRLSETLRHFQPRKVEEVAKERETPVDND